MATECGYRGHPACFPEQLPAWFIKLFTDQGDTVLDPFAGSGTTLVAAQKLRRVGIGIDTSAEYCAVMHKRIYGDKREGEYARGGRVVHSPT